MHKTGCSGETRVVLHVHEPAELESIVMITIIMSSPRRRGSTRVRLPWSMQAKGGLKARNKLAYMNDWDVPPGRQLTAHIGQADGH